MIDIFARARGQINPRDPITQECYEAIEQLAKEAADLASEWDIEHNFSHFFDDEYESGVDSTLSWVALPHVVSANFHLNFRLSPSLRFFVPLSIAAQPQQILVYYKCLAKVAVMPKGLSPPPSRIRNA